MGIKRFIIDTKDTVELVYSKDDAIDVSASDIEKYLATGNDEHLVIKPGCTAAVFVVRALGERDERRAMTRAFADSDAKGSTQAASLGVAHEAFNLGLIEVRNVEKPGDVVPASEISLSGEVAREIGMHIMRISGLGGGDDSGASTDTKK